MNFFEEKVQRRKVFLRIIVGVFKWMDEKPWEMFLGNGKNSFSEFYLWDDGLLFCINSG
jgi:hypothetical protein